MIELPEIFKNDIQGRTTYLTPLIVINNRVFLSTKKTNLSNNVYKPLVKSMGNISESVNIRDRKYRISDSKFSFYNYKYNEKTLMDTLLEAQIFNATIEVYYKSQNADKLSDCLKVYSGYIRDITEHKDVLKVSSEDKTEITLNKDVPKRRTSTSEDLPEKHREKVIPMVYGLVDKAHLVYDLLQGEENNLKLTSDTYYPYSVEKLQVFDNDAYAEVVQDAEILPAQAEGTIFKRVTPRQYEIKNMAYFVIQKHSFSDDVEDENTVLTSEGRAGSPLAFDMAEVYQKSYLSHVNSEYQQFWRPSTTNVDETAKTRLDSFSDISMENNIPIGQNPSYNTKGDGIYIAMPEASALDTAFAVGGGLMPLQQNKNSFTYSDDTGTGITFENLFGLIQFNFESNESFPSGIVTTLLEDDLETEKDFKGKLKMGHGQKSCYGATGVLQFNAPKFCKLFWQLEEGSKLTFNVTHSASENGQDEVNTFYNIDSVYDFPDMHYFDTDGMTKNIGKNNFQIGLREWDESRKKFVLTEGNQMGAGYYYYFYFKDLFAERTAVIKDFSTKKLFAKVIGRRDNTSERYTGRFSEQVTLTGTSLRSRGDRRGY